MNVPPSCFETSEITCPASEVALVAILLEDILSVLREMLFALVELFIRVVVVGLKMRTLERIGSLEKERSDMMTNGNAISMRFNNSNFGKRRCNCCKKEKLHH